MAKKQTKTIGGWKTDMPLWLIGLLALLLMPRVVLHDLHVVPFDSTVYVFWAVAPLVVWLVVALLRKTKRPFYDFVVLGLCYGLFLALTHQILWNASWGDNPPHIGGNLAGQFDPLTESLILRTAAFISSVVTGLVTGIVFGVIAGLATWVRKRAV